MAGIGESRRRGRTDGRPDTVEDFFGFAVEYRIQRAVGELDRVALVAPGEETVGVVFHVAVTHALQGLGGQRTALIDTAVDDDRGRLVGDFVGDAKFEPAARQDDLAARIDHAAARIDFIIGADIDYDQFRYVANQALEFGGIDIDDPLPDLFQVFESGEGSRRILLRGQGGHAGQHGQKYG